MHQLRTTIASMLFGMLVAASPAQAQTALTPPEIATYVEADYPVAARDAGREASVELELTVGVDGLVTDARVVAPAGDGFDEAALAAVHEFVFTPATKDGQPIPARIRYRYVFELPEPAPAPDAAISTGQIEGRILSRADGEVLAGVEIIVTAADGSVRRVATDETGTFALTDLPAGTYHVSISALDHASFVHDEHVVAGETASVTYRLTPTLTDEAAGSFGAVATIEAPSREITRRSIEAAEMTKLAGTRGDALRGVELLPGVARPPGPLGMLIVRGSAPTDSQVFLDGEPVQQLYHFGGLTSFVSGSLLQRIDLYPGNFSTRYGRKIGGIVEAELRDPRTDRIHAEADVNMIDAFALVEGPITKTTSFAVAGRRSYVDGWIGPALEAMNAGLAAVPVYYDWQGIAAYRPTARDRIRVVAYASSDDLKVVVANPSGAPTSRDRVGLANSFHRVRAEWKHTRPTIEQSMSFALGTRAYRADVGPDISLDADVIDMLGRADWKATPAQRVELRWGLDVQNVISDIVYDAPAIRQMEGNPDKFGRPEQAERTRYEGVGRFFRPAAYAEAAVSPLPALTIAAGVRVDRFSEISEWAVDPRATAKYTLGATTFKGGVGRFSQPPEEGEALEGLGNPNLEAQHAMHYGGGVDHDFTDRISLGVEGYYKQLDNMIVGLPTGERDNSGSGRIYGVEVAGRWQPGGPISGFLSYTLSRSERLDGDAGRWRLFDYDQTHILTVAGSYKLGRGWELGGTFRLVSGNPETPVVAGIYDADIDSYRPIYGDVNSARNPMFHRLDLRVEKQFRLADLRMAGYLDLQNAYNRKNREGTAYNFDFSERADTPGLPLLPSLGIKGEL